MSGGRTGPVDAYVGARLRALRRQGGRSQAALAEVLGVSFQQVQKYENGANRLPVAALLQAADWLGVSPLDLLPPRAAAAERDLEALRFTEAPDTTALVGAWDQLTRRQQREIVQLVLSLAQKNAGRGRPPRD